MHGIFEFKFIGYLLSQSFALLNITIFRQLRNAPYFAPIHCNLKKSDRGCVEDQPQKR